MADSSQNNNSDSSIIVEGVNNMKTFNSKQELADFLHLSYSTVDTNFPKVVSTQLAQGWKVERIGRGKNATYTVEKVTPEYIDKSQFSTRKPQIVAEDLPNEIWVPAFGYPNHEVSSLGRVRRRIDKTLVDGVKSRDGYCESELSKGKRVRFHRLILQSFDPREDWKDLTVDHINGIRSDNRLENLRWAARPAV